MKVVQQTRFLRDLVHSAARGELVPASFQRPYVWSQTDVLAMFESVLKGYPLGSFLLWTPYGKADLSRMARPRLGPLSAGRTSATTADSVLLDGQNRLASLAWALRDRSQSLPEDMSAHELAVWGDEVVLSFDLQTQQFAFVTAEQADQGLKIPARALLDGAYANPLIRQRWAGPWAGLDPASVTDALKTFDKAQDAFSNARAIATSLEHATVSQARDAFLHICKVGVPMSASDFETAVQWVEV